MSRNTKRIAVVLAVALALVVAAGPAMAALTYDSETVNSASTSDLVGGETVTELDNSSQHKNIQVISDNASTSTLTNPEEAFTLEATVNDTNSDEDGTTFYTNTSTFTVVNASAGHYAINVSHAELFNQLERDVDETVSVDVTTTFNKSETDAESATITINAQNGDDRAVEYVSDEDFKNSSGVDATNESNRFSPDVDYVTLDQDKVITENTTVSFILANGTVAEKYTTAYDFSSFSSSDYIYTMTATAEGKPIMVFNQNVGEDRDAGIFSGGFDGTEDTYAVYKHNGGDHGSTAQFDVVPQGDHAEKASLEVTSSGNQKPGFNTALRHFGLDAARSAGIGTTPGGLVG